MKVKTAFSNLTDVREVSQDIQQQLGNEKFALVLYFVSSSYDTNSLAEELYRVVPYPMIGCTTAGEIISGQALKNSIVAMGFPPGYFQRVGVGVATEISSEHPKIQEGMQEMQQAFGLPIEEWSFDKHIGFILIDGLSKAEEKVMEILGDSTDVLFVGGSAGDDLKFEKTQVFVNGKAYDNAAVMAIVEPAVPYRILKTQSFDVLPEKLVATKVNEQERVVLEFNGKPALTAYAEALHAPVTATAEYFMQKPVGLISDGAPFVRSPQQIKDDSIVFYCNVLEGMELSLLDSTDIVKDTQHEIDNIQQEMPISAIVNFHCILRTLQLQLKDGKMQEYVNIFKDTPTIGFSTYGEQYIGHINQTSTMVIFGE